MIVEALNCETRYQNKTIGSKEPQMVFRIYAEVPMKLLGFFPGLRFKKVVEALTEMSGISFADEVVRLGPEFMDDYEDPLIHRQNKQI